MREISFLFGVILLLTLMGFVSAGCTNADDGSEQQTMSVGQTLVINGLAVTVNSIEQDISLKLTRVYNSSLGYSNDEVKFSGGNNQIYYATITSEGYGLLSFQGRTFGIIYNDDSLVVGDEYITFAGDLVVNEGEFVSSFYDVININFSSSVVSGVISYIPVGAVRSSTISAGIGNSLEDLLYSVDLVSATYNSATIKVETFCTDCSENWDCTTWSPSTCTNPVMQTRTCTDLNGCNPYSGKPSESKTCTPDACVENWTCSSWSPSTCNTGTKTRNCNDANSCGTTTDKPSETKTCKQEVIDDTETTSNNENTGATSNNGETNQLDESILGIAEKFSFVLNGREISAERDENGEIIIDFGQEDLVKSALDLVKDEFGTYMMTSLGGRKKVNITVDEAIMKANKIDEIDKIEIEEYKTLAVYSIYGTKDSKILFTIPKKAKVVQKVNIENGKLMKTELPWWRFFALGI